MSALGVIEGWRMNRVSGEETPHGWSALPRMGSIKYVPNKEKTQMNILLIYPEFPDTFWSFKHALKFVGKRSALPPLGLLTIASMLPREWSLRLVDTNVRHLTKKDLAWADYAFISAMVVQRESARRIITRCKESDVQIVAGGPLFQTEHDDSGLSYGPGARQPMPDLFIRPVRGLAANAPAHVGVA
jgi:hypothetical protein